MSTKKLPHVLVSSVIRTANFGESHGGLYVVDLESERAEQVVNWDDTNISFRERGAERGLRGLAFDDGLIYVTTANKIVAYDPNFTVQGEYTNPYLLDCHETWLEGRNLYVTSTSYDSVLTFNLDTKTFTDAVCLRNDTDRIAKKILWKIFGIKNQPGHKVTRFDPSRDGGPRLDDVMHMNGVFVADGVLYLSSYRTRQLLALKGDRLEVVAPLPENTHNAQLFRDGILVSNTGDDAAMFTDMKGNVRGRYPTTYVAENELEFADLPDSVARAGFVRGLTVYDDTYVIFGTSPATVVIYDLDSGEWIKSVTLTKDVRNAVHGLEIYPYA